MSKLFDLAGFTYFLQKLKASYKNNLTTTAAGYALDARQGKALNDAKAAKAVDTTATLSTSWTGSEAPFTQSVAVTGMTAAKKIFVGLAATATAAQAAAAAGAMLLCTAQAAGSITVTAYGEKPEVAIPIIIREVG